MNIALCVITLLYGLLSVIAPLAQWKDKEKRVPSVCMLCGGLLLIAAAVLKLLAMYVAAMALIVLGVLCVCTSAVMNGLKNKNLHVSHHIIRIAVSCALIVGFALT